MLNKWCHIYRMQFYASIRKNETVLYYIKWSKDILSNGKNKV